MPTAFTVSTYPKMIRSRYEANTKLKILDFLPLAYYNER